MKVILAFALVAGLSSCGSAPQATKFKTYDGPPITLVQVQKANRKLYLMSGSQVIQAYDIALGFQPVGHKQFEGDGKTPEGTYLVDRRNPNSQYYLSVGISYPNEQDRSFADAAGRSPGGDIFIHGDSPGPKAQPDWTAGCIAVTDPQIEDIYAMVRDGTVVQILP